MAGLGSLVVELSANIAKFEAGMSRASYLADQNMKQVQKSVDSLKGTLQGLAGVVAGAFAFEGLSNFIDQVIEAGSANEKFTASMQAMGRIYGISKESLDLVSGSIEKLGIDGHEAAVSMSNFLKYGIEITKLPRLAEMAKDLSAIDTEGRSAREMFMQLVNAIGRGPRALMQLRLGSGEEFKAMSKDIKEMEDEAFLSMPERANLAFKLLEKATKGFEGVSSSVMDTYKKKQADAALAAQQFKEALFDIAKPVLSAVIQEQINSWAAFTAALANNRQALTQTGETLALFVGRIANAVGNVVTFVNAHKEWAEALLGLYGMTKLITLVGGLASTLATAVIAVGKFIAGLTTLKGLVSSPWPPVVITVTAVGIAAVLTGLRQVIQAKLEASGVINPNVAGRPVTAGPGDQVISAEGTKSSARERAEIISQYEAQANAAKDLAEKERIANEQAAEAARRRQEEVKTTMPLDKGGKGGGGDAELNRLRQMYDSINRDIAKASEGSMAEVEANLTKTINDIYKKTESISVTEADVEVAARKRAALQKQKIEEEFNTFVGRESGNVYMEIEAQAREWLTKYKGIKGAEESIADISNRKKWETDVRFYTDKLTFEKSLYEQAASVMPSLNDQNAARNKSLELEIEINRWVQATKLQELERAGIITRAQADEYKGYQALIDQQKKFNQAMEQDKGLQGWAYGRNKDSNQRNTIKDLMGNAESFMSNAFSSGIQGVLSKDKNALKDIGKTMFQGFLGEIHKGSITKSFDALAKLISPMGKGKGKDKEDGGLGDAANLLTDSAVQLGLSAGGLALSGIGIMTNSQALVMAGTVLQVAGMAIQVYEMLTATTQMSASVALIGSASALTTAAWALQQAAASMSKGGGGGGLLGDVFGSALSFIPGVGPFLSAGVKMGSSMFMHGGGPIYAHAGWPGLRSDEVPIIAQTGERVLSRQQNRDYEAGKSGGHTFNISYSPNYDRRPTGYERRRDIREMNKALASEMGRRN